MIFDESILKIERAKKHITDINEIVLQWVRAEGFHTVGINRDFHRKLIYMRVMFDELTFPATDIALAIGDALHNLRSALDLMWYQVIIDCRGKATDWTIFPVRETRDKVMIAINSALKQKQIFPSIGKFVLDTVKPYKAGNFPLWALHRLNIRDKHELLIPVLQLVRFDDIHLEDENGTLHLANRFWIADQSSSFRLDEFIKPDPWKRKFTVKSKGHASAAIIFDLGVPFEGEAIPPSLNRIAEEVTRTIEAFDILGALP